MEKEMKSFKIFLNEAFRRTVNLPQKEVDDTINRHRSTEEYTSRGFIHRILNPFGRKSGSFSHGGHDYDVVTHEDPNKYTIHDRNEGGRPVGLFRYKRNHSGEIDEVPYSGVHSSRKPGFLGAALSFFKKHERWNLDDSKTDVTPQGRRLFGIAKKKLGENHVIESLKRGYFRGKREFDDRISILPNYEGTGADHISTFRPKNMNHDVHISHEDFKGGDGYIYLHHATTGRPIGLIHYAKPNKPKHFPVDEIAVHSDFQGKGLMRQVGEHLRNKGYSVEPNEATIKDVSKGTIKTMKRLGFKPKIRYF